MRELQFCKCDCNNVKNANGCYCNYSTVFIFMLKLPEIFIIPQLCMNMGNTAVVLSDWSSKNPGESLVC